MTSRECEARLVTGDGREAVAVVEAMWGSPRRTEEREEREDVTRRVQWWKEPARDKDYPWRKRDRIKNTTCANDAAGAPCNLGLPDTHIMSLVGHQP